MIKLEKQPEIMCIDLPPNDARVLVAAAQADPLKYACPNGAQEKYFTTFANCLKNTQIPVILCTYANGVGKTTESLRIMLNLIYGPQSGWYDYPIFRSWPYPKVIWYCSEAESLVETVQPMIEQLISRDINVDREYQDYKDGKRIVSKMVFSTGWTVFFKTFAQESKTYESGTVGLIIADEPMPEAHWKAIKSRRRMGCVTLLPMTPLDCPPYVFDEVERAATNGIKGYYHITADVYEACKRRGIRGHLDPDIVDDMVAQYDPEEREARVYGRPMYFAGKIFDTLDERKHFVDPDRYPIHKYARIVQIVDPHDSRPSLVVWGAINPDSRHIVFAESPADQSQPFWEMKRGQTTDQEVKDWFNFEDTYQLRVSQRIMDKQFGWQTRGQKTFAKLYLEAGQRINKKLVFDRSYSGGANEDGEIKFGHRVVKKLLEPIADGGPGLVIYKNCYHVWHGLTHYIRRKITGKSADIHIQAEGQIVEKYKDAADVIRYFVCAEIKASVPAPPETPYDKVLKEVTRRHTETTPYT